MLFSFNVKGNLNNLRLSGSESCVMDVNGLLLHIESPEILPSKHICHKAEHNTQRHLKKEQKSRQQWQGKRTLNTIE